MRAQRDPVRMATVNSPPGSPAGLCRIALLINRSLVLTIARTYFTEERAVETADIVIPVERYALVYEVPVR
jgi:hypothetical protein